MKTAVRLVALALCAVAPAAAQEKEETIEDIMAGITSSFELPWRDLLEKEYPSEWRNLFSEFSGGFSCGYPLKEKEITDGLGQGSEGERAPNSTCSASVKWSPFSYWFASISFAHYWEPDLQAPWNGDFVYSFGYNDWHPYTFSLTYANYGGNRLNPDREAGEKSSRIEEGGITLAWKFVIPKKIQHLFTVHPTGGLGGSIGYTVVPRAFDLASGESIHWKEKVSLNLKYTIYKWWYVSYSLNYFPHPSQKQPWDPDFTYGFGFFDWHPGTISIQYNNYSGNRYPWNPRSPGTGSFKDGGLSISISWVL